MKRLLCLICCFLLLGSLASAEGELRGYSKEEGYIYVTLGHYMQSIDGGIPEENRNTWTWSRNPIKDTTGMTFSMDPILWRVLTVDEEKAYLASEYVLFAMPMHTNVTEYKTIGSDFGKTQLSAYLNSTFAETAFTSDELNMLLENGTMGRIFLLSSDDIQNKDIGMGWGAGLKGWGTEYAIRVTGLYVFLVKHGAHSAYWVREQSTADLRHARCTKDGGQVGHIVSDRENEGVRPAVYLDMNSFKISGGTGTKTDPYVLEPKNTLPSMLTVISQ